MNIVEDYKENYITGWVKLYRSFVKWEWYTTPNMVHFFIHCLLKANHKDKRWQGINIERGTFITSLDSLKKETGLTHQNIRTCLKRLQKSGEINKQSNKQHTLITICNYDTYQGFNDDANTQSNKQLTNSQQTPNKQLTTTKKYNNINNENKYNSDAEFLRDWNDLRKEYLKKPSFLNRIGNGEDKSNFNDLCNHYTIEDFRNALKGLFKQKKLPNDNTTMQSNPSHFLRYFNSYLTAYHDKNVMLYGKNE